MGIKDLDLYDILDVDFGSNNEEINAQYKKKIKIYSRILSKNNQLTSRQKSEVKTLKVAKYILTNFELRKKYDLLKIIGDSDEQKSDTHKEPEIKRDDVPLRKDKHIDYDLLSNRQFERFQPQIFDLSKDRQLRISKVEKRNKN